MKRIGANLLLCIILTGCFARKESSGILKTGIWRATVEIQGQSLPFTLECTKDNSDGYDFYLRNAGERLLLDEVTVYGDSVDIVLHIFDANLKARIIGDTLRGEFIKNFAKDYRLPFQAVHGQYYRFEKGSDQQNIAEYGGKYRVEFIHEKDTTEAIAIFQQSGDSVTGTFLTPTGDYRYLEGNVANGQLNLSTFDGNYAYLFKATKDPDGRLRGEYYSGKTWYETWVAIKDENASLPDADALTYLKEGYDKIAFSFPDAEGKIVSLTDQKYQNKVVIIQLLGTWCPNCMDETLFLKDWYNDNRDRGVEIIGLAYERKADFTYASERVKKMVKRLDVRYDIAIAGTENKEEASKTLPMLNKVIAFPTTIFIGKDGKVKKIHTGFSGPGTGIYYEQFIQHFNETVNELLTDKSTSLNN